MGEVEIAIREEGRFRRTYAIKRLREAYADDEEVRRMFLDEARVAGLLNHPNVVSVIDFGEDERGPFLVMDYVEGMSLARLISWAVERGTFLPLQLCARVIRQVAAGLHAAHELRDHRGRSLELVHRDVSPQNILISYDGVARLTDFGIARAYGRYAKTGEGVLKGKTGYMSPEQLRFEDTDRRSDLFSLGVVVFEMLTTKRLFTGENGAEVARKVLHAEAPDVAKLREDVPPALSALVARLLSKHRSDRPDTARQVATELERIIASLVDDEAPLELGEFMREHFDQERKLKREEMEQLFQRAVGPATSGLIAVDVDEGVPTAILPRKRSGLVPLALVAAAAGVAIALAGFFLFRTEGEPAEAPVSTDPEPAATTPSEPPPEVTPSERSTPVEASVEPPTEEFDVEDGEEPEMETPVVERESMRRRGRGRRTMRPSMMNGDMEGELWGWR
jgi:serine/threonine-protein kinase